MTITPATNSLFPSGTNLVIAAPLTLQPVLGQAATNLFPGVYQVTIQGISQPYTFYVTNGPAGSLQYAASQIVSPTNFSPGFSYAYPAAVSDSRYTPAATNVPGNAGYVLTTDGAGHYYLAAGSGGGLSVPITLGTVDGATATWLSFVGATNGYLQIYAANTNAYGSTDLVLGNSISSPSSPSNYVNLGLNGPLYNGGYVGGTNAGYLYTAPGIPYLWLGAVEPSGAVQIFAGGPDPTNTVLSISTNGARLAQGTFTGNGAGLTNVPVAGLVGAVAKANNGSDFAQPAGVRTNIVVGDVKDFAPSDADNVYWSALHRQGYEDASQFNDAFANLAGWGNNTVMIASNGAAYYSGTNDAVWGAAMYHPFTLAATDNARVLLRFVMPTNSTATGNGYIMAGFTSDSALNSVAHNFLVGMGFGLNGGNTNYQVVSYNTPGYSGTYGSPITSIGYGSIPSGASWWSTNYPGAGPYWLEISADTNNVSFVVTDQSRTNEMRFVVARSVIGSINGLYVWSGDSRLLGGVGIGPVGAKKHSGTITPRTGVEGNVDFVTCTTDGPGGQNIRVQVPKIYDSRTPAPLVILAHGTSGIREQTLYDYYGASPDRAFWQSLLAAGYIIAASANHSDAIYGAPVSITDTDALLAWVRQHYAIADIYLVGISAGGPVALNYAASHHAKIAGVYGISPVCSLWSMFTNTVYTAGASFITTAYGITGGGANWVTATAGYDPANSVPLDRYAGVPFRATYGSADTTVPYAANAVRMATILSGWSAEASATNCGAVGHGDAATYSAADFLAFAQRCSTAGPAAAPTSDGAKYFSGTLAAAGVISGNGGGLTNLTAADAAGAALNATNGLAGNLVGTYLAQSATNAFANSLRAITNTVVQTNDNRGLNLSGPLVLTNANNSLQASNLNCGNITNTGITANSLASVGADNVLKAATVTAPVVFSGNALSVTAAAAGSNGLMSAANFNTLATNTPTLAGVNVFTGNSNYVTALDYTGSTPTIATNGGNGTGGSAVISGTDTRGFITLTTGTALVASTNYFTVTYAKVRNTMSTVFVTAISTNAGANWSAANQATVAAHTYVSSTTTGWSLNSDATVFGAAKNIYLQYFAPGN